MVRVGDGVAIREGVKVTEGVRVKELLTPTLTITLTLTINIPHTNGGLLAAILIFILFMWARLVGCGRVVNNMVGESWGYGWG